MDKTVFVRNVDSELWKLACEDAKKRKWNMAAWVDMAINLMLHFEERAEGYCRDRGWKEPK